MGRGDCVGALLGFVSFPCCMKYQRESYAITVLVQLLSWSGKLSLGDGATAISVAMAMEI